LNNKFTIIRPFIPFKFIFDKKNYSIENLAVAFALLYVVGAAYNKIWCWLASIISSILYFVLCYRAHLYLESILQVFFIVMSIFGWLKWNKKSETRIINFSVTKNSLNHHLNFSFILIMVSVFLGYIFTEYTVAALPYLDAPITVFSIYATFLTAQKKLESWIYWFIVNAASVDLYFQRGLITTSILFFVYCLMSVYGFYKWNKLYKVAKPQ
jgi:nicotinamide mononucleotide transporter